MSIITKEALERCADELERKEHIEALRTLEHARAKKRIDDYYDARLRGEEPTQLGRRMFDRRSNSWPPLVARFSNDRRDNSWSALAARFTPVKQPGDMADVNLHLSSP